MSGLSGWGGTLLGGYGETAIAIKHTANGASGDISGLSFWGQDTVRIRLESEECTVRDTLRGNLLEGVQDAVRII